jgi:hypothetical protein
MKLVKLFFMKLAYSLAHTMWLRLSEFEYDFVQKMQIFNLGLNPR